MYIVYQEKENSGTHTHAPFTNQVQAPYEPWSYNFMIMIIIMIRAMSIVLVMVMITFRIMTMIKTIVVFFY